MQKLILNLSLFYLKKAVLSIYFELFLLFSYLFATLIIILSNYNNITKLI
ncbi:hypothetical protein QN326_03550 [Candidatus Phytoplasma asteris]|uniref:Uncharacterized protein n=1 Tax=Candidatus Phytoplasma asteris TaxID=85620 RepID=A0ABZ3CEY3_9MOLU